MSQVGKPETARLGDEAQSHKSPDPALVKQIERLRELLEKATPGPWKVVKANTDLKVAYKPVEIFDANGDHILHVGDTKDAALLASLIAEAITALPKLLDALEARAPASGVASKLAARLAKVESFIVDLDAGDGPEHKAVSDAIEFISVEIDARRGALEEAAVIAERSWRRWRGDNLPDDLEGLEACDDIAAAIRNYASALAAVPATPSPAGGTCARCKGRGYLVGDAELDPYAVKCPDCSPAGGVVELEKQLAIYRDCFEAITAKATPYGGGDVECYVIPKAPLHMAAGKIGYQAFGIGEQLARLVEENKRLRAGNEPVCRHGNTNSQICPLCEGENDRGIALATALDGGMVESAAAPATPDLNEIERGESAPITGSPTPGLESVAKSIESIHTRMPPAGNKPYRKGFEDGFRAAIGYAAKSVRIIAGEQQ